MHILLTDQDMYSLNRTTTLLEEAGYEVHTARSMPAIEEALTQKPIDLVVLDDHVPELDVTGMCRTVHNDIGAALIILATQNDSRELTQGLMIGADDYLTRPFAPAELLARIRAVLRRRANTIHEETHSAPILQSFACPYLGLAKEPKSVYGEPTTAHRCYVSGQPNSIDSEHQEAFCMNDNFTNCARYVAPPVTMESNYTMSRITMGKSAAWLAGIICLIVTIGYVYLSASVGSSGSEIAAVEAAALTTSTETLDITPPAQQVVFVQTTATPTATPTSATPAQSPTTPAVLPGQRVIELVPASGGVGWVSNEDGRRKNNIGDRSMHAGYFDGHIYYGVLQFNLSPIQTNAEIEQATLELVGLNSENLGTTGRWDIQILTPQFEDDLSDITYEALDGADVAYTLSPSLTPDDLGVRRTNVLTLTNQQVSFLEDQIEDGTITFRIVGPTDGNNNLFTWYTGVSSSSRPMLRLVFDQPPTPLPVIVVNTPTPENVVTAAAVAKTATYEATVVGTPTPLPLNYITATPPVIVTNTPTPETVATAQMLAAEATAQAFLTGTPTPMTNVWTATPVPPTPMPTSTPTSTPLPLVMPIGDVLALTPTGTPASPPTATPASVPNQLHGRIAFLSDRFGEEQQDILLVTPDGNNMALLTDRWAYDRAKLLNAFSPDRNRRAFSDGEEIGIQDANGFVEMIAAPGSVSYDPAWSPDGKQIAFVSQINGNDEIFVVDVNTKEVSQLTSNQWEWDKHPSWSPDGTEIVFWSNRVTGRSQLWIMNADGSNQRLLFENQWNNSDPVWLK